MKYDDPIEIDFRPSVPAIVRSELNKLLRSTTRIVIDEETAPGKTGKINAIHLTNKQGGYPKEPLEEIAEGITAIMHIAWSEQETEDPDVGLPPMTFVVTCEHYEGKHRRRFQFTYTYRGEREPDYIEDTMSTEDRAVMRVLELHERLIQQQYAVIGDYQRVFLEIVNQNTAQASAGATVMKEAIPMFIAGVQGQLNAKAMEFSAAKEQVREEATNKRIEMAWEYLGPFAGLMLQQYMARKGGHPPGAHPPGFTHGAPAQPPGSEDPGSEEIPQHLLATMARAFGDLLTSDQRRVLNRSLTKKQSAYFDDLFCADTDVEAHAAYKQVLDHAADKLGVLQRLLLPDQAEMLTHFIAAATAYKPDAEE